jgi:hypothetical protein
MRTEMNMKSSPLLKLITALAFSQLPALASAQTIDSVICSHWNDGNDPVVLSCFANNSYPGMEFSFPAPDARRGERSMTSIRLYSRGNHMDEYKFDSPWIDEGDTVRYSSENENLGLSVELVATDGTQTDRLGNKYNYVGTMKFHRKWLECSMVTSLRCRVHRK